ncbi:MAG: SDR family NAD(P)-dependent oxidoreductase [Synechococcaceae cyanobacterium]|nr:SDR family NAD(P)-dependent oxidoreductase [Synechococcaceae cyanobacterium]
MTTDRVNPWGIGRVLVLGGGYTGRRFARHLAAHGVPALLTGRQPPEPTPDGTPSLAWLRFDSAAAAVPSAADLAGVSHVLVTIPPDPSGEDPVLRHLGPTLRALHPAWVGYLSTTGVYGSSGGAWVNEESPTNPAPGRSAARLASEQAWRDSGLPLHVFRLPAIYGPGRTPFASLRNGEARLIHKPGQVFSRIHVDDIVGAILHTLRLPSERRPDTLILADAQPCPSSETLGYAAHLLGLKLPPLQRWEEVAPSLSPMARSFWSENRRADSRRLRNSLGYRLQHPTYREGYRACLAEANGDTREGPLSASPRRSAPA